MEHASGSWVAPALDRRPCAIAESVSRPFQYRTPYTPRTARPRRRSHQPDLQEALPPTADEEAPQDRHWAIPLRGGRFQRELAMTIHGFTFASNHYHLVLSPEDAQQQLAAFMRRFQQKLSTEITRLHGWKGPMWEDRYHAVVLENHERAQVRRLRYILSHGVKEGLVRHCAERPGAHCVEALAEGAHLVGTWYDRTAQYQASRWSGEPVDEEGLTEEGAEEEEVILTPLPCWAHSTEEERRELIRAMIAEIEAEARAKHRANGTRPLGVRKVLQQDPWSRPKRSKNTSKPWFHTATAEGRQVLERAYQLFVEAFRDAAELLRDGHPDPRFPEGSFPPGRPFVPHLAPG